MSERSETQESPEYLAAHVREALACDPRGATLGLDVRVVAGRLYLSGVVSSEEQRQALGEVAAEHAGDVPVQNDVVVAVPDEGGEPEDLA